MACYQIKSNLNVSAAVAVIAICISPGWAAAQVDEIIVTAQKRSESLQTVPIAVTAYTAESLDILGVTEAVDLVTLTPGLGETTQAGSNRNYFLRGIGTTDFHLTAASAVGQYSDEITLTSGFQARSALFDMERVEILKGPQNTLFGLNTTGGAINYISNKPEIGAGLNGKLKLTVGNDNMYGVEAAAGFDNGEDLAARLALYTNKHDGPFQSVTNGEDYGDDDIIALRGSVLWAPADRTQFTVNVHASESKNNGAVVRALGTRAPDGSGDVCAQYDPSIVQDFSSNTDCISRNGGGNRQPAVDPSTGDFEVVSQGFGLEDISTKGFSVKLNHDFGFASLNLIASHDNLDFETAIDSDGTASTLLHLQQADDRDTNQYEARLVSSDAAPFRWITGVYYLDESADSFTAVSSPGLGGGIRAPNVQLDHSKKNLGLYGQVEFDISETLTATGGLRWSKEDIEANYLPSNPVALDFINAQRPVFADDVNRLVREQFAGQAGFDANGFELVRQVSREFNNEDVGYTLKLDWQPNTDHLLYASHSKGFKGAAADIRAAFALVPAARLQADLDDSALAPESLLAYELGYKGAYFDNRVRVDLAGFYYQYNDLQQFITAGGVPTLDNADEAEVLGLDGNIRYANDGGFYLDLGFAFLDTEITDVGDSTRFLEGAELANSPSFSGSVTASQDIRVGDNMLTISGNVTHTGDAIKAVLLNATDRTGNIRTQPAFTLVNANATYRFGIDERYALSIFGKNLTNERYCGFLGVNEANRTFNDGIGARDLSQTVTCRTSRGATRTYGASFVYNF